NLATMLVYIFTDAEFSAEVLDGMLREAVDESFNMLSVDTDTSTSDTCVLMANGMAGPVDEALFRGALRAGAIRLTEMLARDGEGATKLLRATVDGAADTAQARRAAKAIINSPLVKTMAFGADPNTGRVLMAVGKCTDVDQDPARIRVWINGEAVYENGSTVAYDDAALRESLSGDPVEIRVALGMGDARSEEHTSELQSREN